MHVFGGFEEVFIISDLCILALDGHFALTLQEILWFLVRVCTVLQEILLFDLSLLSHGPAVLKIG